MAVAFDTMQSKLVLLSPGMTKTNPVKSDSPVNHIYLL